MPSGSGGETCVTTTSGLTGHQNGLIGHTTSSFFSPPNWAMMYGSFVGVYQRTHG